MAEISAEQSRRAVSLVRPYAPSWFDWLTDWVEHLRIPVWLFYGLLATITIGVQLVVQWNGIVGPVYVFPLVYVSAAVYQLALMHYLDSLAAQALARFRPLLALDEAEYDNLRYRLTTLPARPALLAALAGAVYATWTILSVPYATLIQDLHFADTPLSIHLSQLFTPLTGAVGGLLVYHTLHQLRVVDHIYDHCLTIDLYQLPPLYAFSALSAQTTMGIAFIIYLTYVVAPPLFNVETARLGLVFVIGCLFLTFVLPLRGAHRLLVEEKDRRRAENGKRQRAAITELHRRVDAGELVDMASLQQTMTALEIEHTTLDRISTWPWKTDTFRAVLLALFFPVVVWLTQWVLQRVLTH